MSRDVWYRCAAAVAIDPKRMDDGQLYELYGKLLSQVDRQHGTLSVEQAIKLMTRDERLALKERVAGVIAFPKRKEESHATS